jgi:hypothetical protein
MAIGGSTSTSSWECPTTSRRCALYITVVPGHLTTRRTCAGSSGPGVASEKPDPVGVARFRPPGLHRGRGWLTAEKPWLFWGRSCKRWDGQERAGYSRKGGARPAAAHQRLPQGLGARVPGGDAGTAGTRRNGAGEAAGRTRNGGGQGREAGALEDAAPRFPAHCRAEHGQPWRAVTGGHEGDRPHDARRVRPLPPTLQLLGLLVAAGGLEPPT